MYRLKAGEIITADVAKMLGSDFDYQLSISGSIFRNLTITFRGIREITNRQKRSWIFQ